MVVNCFGLISGVALGVGVRVVVGVMLGVRLGVGARVRVAVIEGVRVIVGVDGWVEQAASNRHASTQKPASEK